ncbi:MAG: ImmA/IrrE family metallo-endopeptidase [Pyrinomonadaceae bacterium]
MGKQIVVADGRSGVGIDAAAVKIIESHANEMLVEPRPFDVQGYFEFDLETETGIVAEYAEPPFNAHGYTDIEQMRCVISPSLLEKPTDRRFLRSTIAHEIGHCILHVPEFRSKKNLVRFIHNDQAAVLPRLNEDQVRLCFNPEWQAWRFAGALLMPAPSVSKALTLGAAIEDLQDIFDVNPKFAASRLRALRILPKI